MACQQILRRFAATLRRMEEALVVRDRWHASTKALVHPNGCKGRSPSMRRDQGRGRRDQHEPVAARAAAQVQPVQPAPLRLAGCSVDAGCGLGTGPLPGSDPGW